MFSFIRLKKVAYYIVLFLYLVAMLSLSVAINVVSWGSNISFAFILANGIIAVVVINKKTDIFIVLGLLFTIGADYFLILDGNYLYGLILFLIVQICYAIRTVMFSRGRITLILNVCTRIVVSLVFILVAYLVLEDGINPLVILVMIYGANLLLNCVFSFVHFNKQYLLSFGFLFFICCDIFVAIDFINVENVLGFTDFLPDAGRYAWYFYPFSQMLILLSILVPNPFVRK